MNYFRLKFGSAAADQTQALQAVKQAGGDGIQISDGLCLKSPLGFGELERLLRDKGVAGALSTVDGESPDLSPDEKNFLG